MKAAPITIAAASTPPIDPPARSREVRLARGGALQVGRRTLIMGILNVTPDSFSDGGHYLEEAAAVDRGLELEAQGADIIDVGGESTRPGAEDVAVDVEMARVIPVVRRLAAALRVPISIDTSKSAVARAAIDAGAAMINDVTGLADHEIARVAAEASAALVVGHIRGTPRTMQQSPDYRDVVAEVRDELATSIARARAAGVPEEALLVDPGLGFGKRFEDNLQLLRGLRELGTLPVVVGISRKSFTGHLTRSPPAERLPASLAGAALAVAFGAHVVRAHDVAETRQALAFTDRLLGLGETPP